MEESKFVIKRIIKYVAVGHLIFLICFSFNFKKKSKKYTLTTKVLKENFRTIEKPKPKAKKAVAKVAVKKPNPPKKVEPIKKVAPAKVAVKKTEPPKKEQPAAKKEVKVAQAKKSPKIEPPKELSKPQKLELVLPQMITNLDVEQNDFVEDHIEDEVAECPYRIYFEGVIRDTFKDKLKLGCYVDFEVKLNSQGQVISVKHVKSSDAFSKDFLIENVKHMQFASFFGEMARKSEYTYCLITEGSAQ